MIGLLQRVKRASVDVAGIRIAAIGPGLLVLVGVERGDSPAVAERLAARLLAYRVFPDEAGPHEPLPDRHGRGTAAGPAIHPGG